MGVTLPDQLAGLAMARDADPDLGFPGRMRALCSLPRVNPGKSSHFIRRNGPLSLTMTAGNPAKLPYENLPRLLWAWVCTEAVRLAGVIADKTVCWWDYDQPDTDSLFPSEIRLSEPFFRSIPRQPVPVDLNCLHALRRSTLGLDLYLWLTYRTFTLRKDLPWTWKQVYVQLGSHPDKHGDKVTVQAFRKKCLRELKKIKLAWPELDYTTERRAADSPADSAADPRRKGAARLRLSAPVRFDTAPLCPLAYDSISSLPSQQRPLSLHPHCPKALPSRRLHGPQPPKFAHLHLPSLGLRLPPVARLSFEPLRRRKPAARPLDARPSGRLSLPCSCLLCAAPHSAPLRPPAVGFGRRRRLG